MFHALYEPFKAFLRLPINVGKISVEFAARICRPVPQKSSLPLSVTSTYFFILNVRKIRPTSVEQVSVTRGDCYRYADYGYGSYLTYKYTVQFGDISATAYCIQPSVNSPGSGTYSISKLKDKKALAKVCYYGTKVSGEEGFFAEKHPDFSAGQRFILVHMAASHADGSSDAFSGANDAGRALAMELYNYCMVM